MGTLAAIKTAITVAREVYKFVRELDAQGAARLGPEPAQKDRRRLQRLAVWLHEGEDKGLRRLLKVDNAVDGYIRDVLQSNLLGIYLDPIAAKYDRDKAREAIMAGADGQEEPRVYPVH